jgi:hypothetical protein
MAADDTDLAARMDEVVQKGRAEFPDFDERSAFVVGVGANPGELRQALAELGPDAHRVVAQLADDPEEAGRILGLRGPKLGAALARYGAMEKAAPPVAPKAPEKQAASITDPDLPMAEYSRLRTAQTTERRERKPAATDPYDPKIPMQDYVVIRDQQERARRMARRAT